MTLNLHVYPSPMLNESRLLRITAAMQSAGVASETHLVGVGAPGLPDRERIDDGRLVVRLSGQRVGGGVLGKLGRTVAWYGRVLWNYRKQRVVAVHAHSVWVLPVCWALAILTGAALVYNPHELETRTPTMKGLKRKAAALIERTLLRGVGLVSTVNGSIADWYADNYHIERPVVVRNIPVDAGDRVDLRRRLGLAEDELLYIHTGRLTAGRNIEAVLAAANETRRHVVLLGDGPLGDMVRNAAASPYVHWLPPVEPELVVSYVREADVALCLIDTASLSYRLSSPNKLFEALAAGTPPLCSDLIEARSLLGDSADEWILSDIETELVARLRSLQRTDVERFRAAWPGLPTWDREVAPLVQQTLQLREARA